ncbi:MAG: WbqC family protein [Chitinophagales bacterium]
MQKTLLIELDYLAPIAYYSLLLKYNKVFIEACESFVKATYRNRCEILGPNGRQILSIPVKGGRSHSQAYRQTKIDYTQDWQRNHWNSIRAAYGRSPYFEHYSPYFEKFYDTQHQSLFDFNLSLLETTLKLLKTEVDFSLTNNFEKTVPGIEDWRSCIHPNPEKDKSSEVLSSKPYLQVFSDRHSFQSNLSILDLLFNEGPNAESILLNSD